MQPGQLYLLKDVSRLSGQSVYTLKFYLKLGLIQEAGRSPETRFRYFDDATLEQLSRIRAWRKQDKSLAEIGQLLNPVERSRLKAEGSRFDDLPRASPASRFQPPGRASLGPPAATAR
jgi:DNA-binding transcriptional MerR regulator